LGKAARLGVIGREQHGLANKEPVQTHKPADRTGSLEECEVFKLRSDVHRLLYSGSEMDLDTVGDISIALENAGCYCIRNTIIKQVATANKLFTLR